MGFTIRIGQGELKSPAPEVVPRWCVADLRLPDAPQDNLGYLDRRNCRMPAVTAWAYFCQIFELPEEFSREGVVGLTPAHLTMIQSHLDTYSVVAKLSEDLLMQYNLKRLVWMEWWMRWALAHCSFPLMTLD